MSPGPVYLTSDVHLGVVPESREIAFVSWLRHAAERASGIVLNGDLFDFWFEFGRGIPEGYERVLATLAEVVDAGVPVLLMGGNHDWWGGRYLTDEIGLEFRQESVTLELGGLRTFLAHGDGLGKGDVGYHLLKLILRGRLTRWAFGRLHPTTGSAVARWVSRTEERFGPPDDGDHIRALALEEWAREKLAREPELELVVLGHTHLPSLVEVEPGRWYANSGDWVRHSSYLLLEDGRPPLLASWEL